MASFPHPKPSPRGEGGPAQPGRMRGRPGTQRSRRKPAYRRQAVGHWFSTRKGFGVIAPSSVCFADSFPPRGSRWTWQVNYPYPVCTKRLPQPAQPGGGPLPTVDTGPQARIQKRGIPRRISQTRVGSPEGRNSPLWCSFLHFSQEKWRPPAGIPPGRCAPRWVKSPTTRRVRNNGGRPPAQRRRFCPATDPTVRRTDDGQAS